MPSPSRSRTLGPDTRDSSPARPRISTTSSFSSVPAPSPTPGSATSPHPRPQSHLPSHLLPPQTIVSPPSPVDPTRDDVRFASPGTSPLSLSPSVFADAPDYVGDEGNQEEDGEGGNGQGKDEVVQYDSPEDEDEVETPPSRGPSPSSRRPPPRRPPHLTPSTSSVSTSTASSSSGPIASDVLSTSPMPSPALLTPRNAQSPPPSSRSPGPSFTSPFPSSPSSPRPHPASPSRLTAPPMLHNASALSTSTSSTSGSTSTSGWTSGTMSRIPSPSSPDYHPRRSHHRRESSTHKVRETAHGEQWSTEDGKRMVNQYRIGKSLGKGAYAKVELGVDSDTGVEYAIKEFSKSRLSHQSLLERQQRIQRQRARRTHPPGPRGSPHPPGVDGKRKAGTVAPGGGPEGVNAAPSGPSDEPGADGARDRDVARSDLMQDGVMHGGQLVGPARGDEQAKTLPPDPKEMEKEDPLALIRREIAVMKKLDHPNIIHLYEAISVPNADALFLVLEYLPGGVLMHVEPGKDDETCVPPFDLPQTREYFRQLCLGLEYLHANGVAHRDIKPDNILLSADREVVKLCDFGVSEMFVTAGDDRIKKTGGSPAFLSPESFTSSSGEVHGMAVDIWALGVVLYCMLVGKLPFNVSNPIDLFRLVREEEPVIPEEWDDDLKDLVKRKLDKNPETRIAMPDIREHPWVTAHGSEPMITTEDNLYYVGKHVDEPTQEELSAAFTNLRSVFTVVRAVQKMRRLHLHRRSISGQTQPSTPASPGETPSSPNPSFDLSSAPHSQTSGSMDSYASQQTATTSITDRTGTTDTTDTTGTTTPPAGVSPQLCESPGSTIREDSGEGMGSGNGSGSRSGEGGEAAQGGKGGEKSPWDKLRIDTGADKEGGGESAKKGEGEGEKMDQDEDEGEPVLVDSPTEE